MRVSFILIDILKTLILYYVHSSVLKTKFGSCEYFFMNLSNHLSIVFRGTTSKPSDVEFSFFRKIRVDSNVYLIER